jgi:glycosyltransferase involved in cell wall biosynthesis
MEILQINMVKGWRGGESQTLLCMEQFRQAGHTVELLARTDEPLALRAQQSGFKVHTYKESLGAALFFLLGKATKYDIIHCQAANSLTWAVLFKWRYKGKLVYTRRTAFPIKKHKEKATKNKWLKVDLFVGVTHSSMNEAIRLGVIEPIMNTSNLNILSKSKKKANLVIPSATIPQNFDVQRLENIIKERNIENKKIIAVVSALTEEKDPFITLDAIHQLNKRRQDFAVLHFGSGKMLEECQRKAKELGLEKTYHFMGFQTKVEELFEGFDAYLLTSRHEGANNGIINSFFNNVPVVSTASGGPNDLIGEHNERGYLCPVGDSTALAKALYDALDSSPENLERIEQALDYAKANHTVEVMANSYLEAFNILLNKA